LIYVLLRSIPFLGALIGFWISLLGLGAAWLVWNENRKAELQTQQNEVNEKVDEIQQDSSD
jgi:hypothetical protein